jgi:hypothetical protein
MLNESFNKTELAKIKSLVKKEIKKLKKSELEKQIKELIRKEFKDVESIDKKFDDKVEIIFKKLLQGYHNLFYRENHLINKISVHK